LGGLIEALAIGLAVGVVIGALGAGGGILSIPILVYLLGQTPHSAAASSLVIVGVTALTSLPHRVRKRHVDWGAGFMFGGFSIVGTFAGSRLSALVSGRVLMILFAVLLASVSVLMARRGLALRRWEATGSAPGGASDEAPRIRWGRVAVTATATGLLTGFFGLGGGFIMVPVLVFALGLGMRKAAGTSLVAMTVTTVSALASRLGTPVTIDWPLTLLFALGSAFGGMLGGPLSQRARSSTLTLIFAGLLAVVAAFTLAQNLLFA
jgi:uncharacterized membrane protein YfcA